MTNYYSNTTSPGAYMSAVTAQMDLWVPMMQVQGLISALRIINFASRASRNTGLAMINNLVAQAPYRITGSTVAADGDIRFSALSNVNPLTVNVAAFWVNLSQGGWQTELSNAQSALAYNDRNNEKTMLTDGGTSSESESVNAPNPQVVRSQYNDASQSFRFALLAFCDLMSNNISVYNYAFFEAKYGLVFSTTPQNGVLPPPPDE